MSSVSRKFSNNNLLPYPSEVVALSYSNNGVNTVVPLTYNKLNGVLDFDFSGSFSASTNINGVTTAYVTGASFGAIHLVSDIGPNIVAWCENQEYVDAGTVRIVEKPIVVRVNQIAVGKKPHLLRGMDTSSTPFDFENISGTSANNFNATYLFKKPLVVTYTKTSEGVTTREYRIFNTQYGGQI